MAAMTPVSEGAGTSGGKTSADHHGQRDQPPVRHRPDAGPSSSRQDDKKEGDSSQDGRSSADERLRDERMHMVIDRLYGPQAHYRAAKKFMKNRIRSKMNNNGMTLYDRIMAYRKLKEGDEQGEEGDAKGPSPDKPATTNQSPQRAGSSDYDSPKKNSPTQRAASRGGHSGTPRHLERSDTSFASVDISDLTALDEEKNRSPSPQPTFDHRPYTAQVGPTNPPPTPSEVSRSGARASPPVKRHSAWTDPLRETPPNGGETSKVSPTFSESKHARESSPAAFGSSSPVIKELQPAYLEVPHIVPTNCRYSSYSYLLRSKSVPDISTTADDTSDNLQSDADIHRSPRTAPGNCRERMRKRRSIPAGQNLSLAQRVYLARRVESYIAANQIQAQQQVGHNYEEQTTARDVHVQLDEKEQKVTERDTSSALVDSTTVTTAAVAASTARSQTTKTESRDVRKTQEEHKQTHEEKYENKETHKEKYEDKETHKEKHVSKDSHQENHKREEEVKRSDSRHDVRKEKHEDRDEKSVERVAKTAVVAKAVSESTEKVKSDREDKRKSVEKHETKEERSEKHSEKLKEETSDVVRSQSKSETSEMEKNSRSEQSSSRSVKEDDKSFVEDVSERARASITEPRTPSPKSSEVPAVEAEESPVTAKAAAAAAAAAPRRKKSSKSRPKSSGRKAKEKENNEAIAALDKMADKNLNRLLGNDDGGDEPEVDQEVLDKVFSPKFQAELDDFLRTT